MCPGGGGLGWWTSEYFYNDHISLVCDQKLRKIAKVVNEKPATFGNAGFKDTVSRDFSAMVFFYIEHLHLGSFFTPHSVFASNSESTNIFEIKMFSN